MFDGLVFGWTLCIYRPTLQSVALAVPEIIAIAVLGWDCEPPILGKGKPLGDGMVSFERAFVIVHRAVKTRQSFFGSKSNATYGLIIYYTLPHIEFSLYKNSFVYKQMSVCNGLTTTSLFSLYNRPATFLWTL